MPSPKKSSPTKQTKKLASKKSQSQVWGIFGGTFDPFHKGHLNSLLTVRKKLKLEKVIVVPAEQSPLRRPLQGASSKDRLAMVAAGLADHGDWAEATPLEIERGGVSYTFDTIKALIKKHPGVKWVLIVGIDQFEHFDQWRDFTDILSLVDLVVTSRPGSDLPKAKEEVPKGLRAMIKTFAKTKVNLVTGHTIHLVPLDDVDVSASEIRRKVREGQPFEDDVPNAVAELISARRLYQNVREAIGDFESFTRDCASSLTAKGAINLRAFDLRKESAPTEFTIIASGTSTRHASSLAEALIRDIKQRYRVFPQGVEGLQEGRWIVVDYGSLMVHVFYDFARQEYRLEDLWAKGEPMKVEGA